MKGMALTRLPGGVTPHPSAPPHPDAHAARQHTALDALHTLEEQP